MNMGRPVIDLTGNKYGFLTVDKRFEEDYYQPSGHQAIKQWECTCDCGNKIIVPGDYLKSGGVSSCGCKRHVKDIIGQKYGKLTVISSYKKDNGKIRYNCLCECGIEVDIDRYDLINGKRTSCGCDKKKERPNRIKDYTGLRQGRLVCIGRDPEEYYTKGGTRLYKLLCQCDCGRIISVERQRYIGGKTKSCGCLMAEKQNISYEEYLERYSALKDSKGSLRDLTGQRFGKLTALSHYMKKSEVTGRKTAMWICKCDCGCEIEISRGNLTSGHTQSCGCIDSVGEMKIAMCLKQYNVSAKKEYTFSDCRDKHPLPFDFGILDSSQKLLGIIEYDGEQHFKVIRFNGMTQERAEESFKIGQLHDKLKTDYCLDHDIPLLRIKYTEKDLIEEKVITFLKGLGVIDGRSIA